MTILLAIISFIISCTLGFFTVYFILKWLFCFVCESFKYPLPFARFRLYQVARANLRWQQVKDVEKIEEDLKKAIKRYEEKSGNKVSVQFVNISKPITTTTTTVTNTNKRDMRWWRDE